MKIENSTRKYFKENKKGKRGAHYIKNYAYRRNGGRDKE